MAKITSKLQVTLPKVLADQYALRPGDEITWEPAGEVIRVIPGGRRVPADLDARLRSFDQASARQRARNRVSAQAASGTTRGWTREDLYRRGSAR